MDKLLFDFIDNSNGLGLVWLSIAALVCVSFLFFFVGSAFFRLLRLRSNLWSSLGFSDSKTEPQPESQHESSLLEVFRSVVTEPEGRGVDHFQNMPTRKVFMTKS